MHSPAKNIHQLNLSGTYCGMADWTIWLRNIAEKEYCSSMKEA